MHDRTHRRPLADLAPGRDPVALVRLRLDGRTAGDVDQHMTALRRVLALGLPSPDYQSTGRAGSVRRYVESIGVLPGPHIESHGELLTALRAYAKTLGWDIPEWDWKDTDDEDTATYTIWVRPRGGASR